MAAPERDPLAPETMTDRIGHVQATLPARYVVERELGSGGMATVFLAEDRKHQRLVAVKVLKPEVAAAHGYERFLREIEIVAGLSHPHILPLHDSGHTDDCLYFVMPYVEGESLRDRLEREGALPIEDAVAIARETADALAYAHAHGVLHRDVKPENILLDAGHAIVADFGVAWAADRSRSDRLTTTGVAPGTPLYISPEQAGGEGPLDGRTDIYSLGCVLYEMLIGEAPYAGSTAQAMMARKMFEAVPSMRVVRETIPPPLEAVVRKALARVPADRFRTASELSDALDRAMRLPTTGPVDTGEPIAEMRSRPPASERDGGLLSSASWVPRAVVGLVGFAILVSFVGFLNVKVLDYKLNVPDSLSPSRTDFFLLGVHVVVPFVIYVTITFLVYEVMKSLLHGFAAFARHVTPIGRSAERWSKSVSTRWRALWQPVDPSGIAEFFFVISVVAGVALILVFSPLLGSMWWADAEHIEILSCSRRPFHRAYQAGTPIVIAILAVSWTRVFRYLRSRGGERRNVVLARWGSGVWILFLFVLTAMPWQMVWGSERERALLNGDRVYIVAEDEAGLLVYNAEEGATTRYQRGELSGLRRLAVSGHLFEEPAVFRSGQPGCASFSSD